MSNLVKQRLLVMNGQRLLQGERNGEWAIQKVDKAGALKPGIYDIYLSKPADKSLSYDGVVLYADKDFVYQRVGRDYVKHERSSFSTVPEAGSSMHIYYEGAKLIGGPLAKVIRRGMSR